MTYPLSENGTQEQGELVVLPDLPRATSEEITDLMISIFDERWENIDPPLDEKHISRINAWKFRWKGAKLERPLDPVVIDKRSRFAELYIECFLAE